MRKMNQMNNLILAKRIFCAFMSIVIMGGFMASCSSEDYDCPVEGKIKAKRKVLGVNEYVAEENNYWVTIPLEPSECNVAVTLGWEEKQIGNLPTIIKVKSDFDNTHFPISRYSNLILDGITYWGARIYDLECDLDRCNFSFTGIDPSSHSARVKCQIPYTLKIEQQYITEIEDDTCEGLKDTLVTDSSVVEKTIYPEITLNPINIIRK